MKFQAPSDFVPDFSKSGGLIAAVAQDAATGAYSTTPGTAVLTVTGTV